MRTALVTGAGRGIGRGIALGLAQAGYAVGLVGRTRAHLDAVAEEIGQGDVCVAAADLVDATAVLDAVARVEEELGGIGLLVNNAGVIERAEVPFVEDDVEDSWRVIEANVRGPAPGHARGAAGDARARRRPGAEPELRRRPPAR